MTSRTDPFEDIEEILDLVTGGAKPAEGLSVDVADTGDAFVVVADLPGYDQDDIDVRLPDDTTLYVTAERDLETIAEAERYVSRERQRASVSRQVGLPEPVDEAETSASYDDGVLTVTLGKLVGGDDEDTEIPVE